MTTETFLPRALYDCHVDRLVAVAGQGDVDLIHLAMGSLLAGRPGLAERLANLDPCPVAGAITNNEIKMALGEHGNVWPSTIRPHVLLAELGG
ncbi:hypothetical protein J6500_22140 [Bradyrhizobium sp. WSM 1704]|uniref:hypothetical protein n=1 Tax=Bradyrhizobium semiaridum TaxID=2821404 RepID=UPI001CE3A548|nr:hypothetical protein [Bradyrhizobium semiaridum]MCA6124572.1 hypothetical protein [Bradyrhizobium semiaridum]